MLLVKLINSGFAVFEFIKIKVFYGIPAPLTQTRGAARLARRMGSLLKSGLYCMIVVNGEELGEREDFQKLD